MHTPSHTSAVPGHSHCPSLQTSAVGHAAPHAPQFALLVARLTQVPSHVTRVDGQMQALSTQESPDEQACPHAPQFFALVVGSTHVPSQRRWGDAQATHAPPTHSSESEQLLPQAPQLSWLVARDTQSVLQSVWGATQAQAPSTHELFVGHVCPQALQFLVFEVGSTHTPSQSRSVDGQGAHAPAAHTSDGAHAVPHAPQLASFTCRFTQLAPHAVRGEAHTQAPCTHVSPAVHAVPHVPQLLSSVVGSRQTPSHTRRVDGQGAQTPLAQT
jgi:hypothetical protein